MKNSRTIEPDRAQAQQLRDELDFPGIGEQIVQQYGAALVRRAVAAIYHQYGQGLAGVKSPAALLTAMCKRLASVKHSRRQAAKAPAGCAAVSVAAPLERQPYSGPLFDRASAAAEMPAAAREALDSLFAKRGR